MSMEMVKNEWKKLAHNKILLLSFIVIMFIPILYAAFFLKSVWDPYGKTGNLPVAVVNMDKSVEYQGKKLDVGDQLVSNLKKNDLLDWNFVSKTEAKKGMEDKKYYMVVTLPENFSANAATLLDKNPKKMNITYETNGSLNYIGEVIGETAAKQLKSEVSANVTEAYAEAIFGQIETVGEGFTQATDGSKQLNDGSTKLKAGNQTLTENLQKLASSSITFSDGAEKLEVGLNQYTDGVAQLDDGAAKLNDGIGQLASNVGPLQAGVGQLNDGAGSLASGLQTYTAGVGQLAGGSQSALAGSQTLSTGLGSLNSQVPQLQSGVTELNSGLTQLADGSSQLKAGLEQLDSGLTNQESQTKIATLKAGLDSVKNGLASLDSQINDPKIGALLQQVAELSTQLANVEENLTNLGATISPQNPANNKQQIVNKINQSTAIDATQKAQLLSEVGPLLDNQAQTQGGYIQNVATTLNQLKPIAEQMPALLQQIQALQTGVSQLNAGFAGNGTAANPGIYGGTLALTDSLNTIHLAINNPDANQKDLLKGATQLNAGLTTAKGGTQELANKVPQLATGVKQLSDGSQALNAGIGQINNGASQLDDNSAKLNAGAGTLSGGINQVASKLPDLISGVTQLNSGSSQLAAGTSKLTENSPQLTSGIGQLASGAGQIQSGSGQLADGSKTLGEGLGTLTKGTKELSTKLADGAKTVNKIQPTAKTYNMLASPDKLTHKEYSHVDNYGAALAPYVMSLALYVGALVFNFIFPIRKISMEGQSSVAWWLSKFSIGTVVAVAMAVIEVSIMLLLGLNVISVGQMYLMAIITALAYMFIVMFLAMTFDNPGRFIGMVLLIVQLGGAGGTFPIPLTNGFFKAIHPFLPMSHSIYGFREAISGGLGQSTFTQSFFILAAIFVVFTGLLLVSMNWLQKRHLDNVSQLDDNQKLQAIED